MIIESLPVSTQAFIAIILGLIVYFHVRYNERSVTLGPTILTTTGIFATFVGIAIGLSQFNAGNIQQTVPALLDGLKTAFWGSIFGVGGALLLKFRQLFWGMPKSDNLASADASVTGRDLALLLKGIQQALVGSDESTLITQMKLARQDSNDRLDALKKAQIEALEKLSELGSKQLVEALKDVIRDFNQKLTEQFGENFKHLNEGVTKLVTWQQQYKDMVETITQELQRITAATQTSADRYEQILTQAESFSRISSDLSSVLIVLNEQRDELRASLQKLGELITKASDGLPTIEKKIVEYTDQMSTAVVRNQAEISKALAENAAQMRGSIESTGKEIGKLNENVSREIATIVAKTKEQVTILDAALAEELKKSLESLGRQLAALSEKFVSDYGPLTDRLRQLVQVAGRVQ